MRLKSNARWMDLPGVECAYQPIGAPSAVDALLNVGHDHRMVGRYTATPGVLPTWSAATGWAFDGTKYLRTGIQPSLSFTMLFHFSGASGDNKYLMGATPDFANAFLLNQGNSGQRMWWAGGTIYRNGSQVAAGVQGLSGLNAYMNGINIATLASAGSAPAAPIYIGGVMAVGSMIGNGQAALIASRPFTAAEMWLASRQMAYCEQNPDWNAWGRRRQYFFAPSAAAIRWPGVGRGGPVGGSPGIRGSQ